MEFLEIYEDNIDFYQYQITSFFENNKESFDFFHPHELTWGVLKNIILTKSKDCYMFMADDGNIVGYGLLRGWDEGFAIPSLGILIDESNRGKGFSKILVSKLHEKAKENGSQSIRLTVYKENNIARSLYIKFGYEFIEINGVLVGTLTL